SRRGFLLAGAALTVAGAVAVGAAFLTGRSASAQLAAAPSVAFIDAGSGKLHGDLPVPTADAGELRTGAGWSRGLPGPGGPFQIDPHTLRVVHTFPMGMIGSYSYAVERGALWFVAADGRTLLRFNPHFGLVTRRIPLSPTSHPKLGAIAESVFLAFANGSVW